MKTEELDYKLPKELIAQEPSEVRSASRLLVYERESGKILERRFNQMGEFAGAGDCFVINDTMVLQARFFGRRLTGAKVEGLFLRECSNGVWEVMLKGGRKLKEGEELFLEKGDAKLSVRLIEKGESGCCILKVDSEEAAEAVLKNIGFPPLPPYIRRGEDIGQAVVDRERYQTVYAARAGAVAAPTAGLHFTDELIGELQKDGACFGKVTLHVGAGTFKPVEAERLEEHQIHGEFFEIDDENAELINSARSNGGRIIAVGTTSVRVLETMARDSRVKAGGGVTELFIKPGYTFKMVDAMVTNFHLPRSTLLALVAGFCGLEEILGVYRYAIENRYRFYSYGDAMLIL